MDKEKFFKEYLKWASENEENKKEAINSLSSIINILNTSDRQLSDEDLEKITGGLTFDCSATKPIKPFFCI